jgi:ABC-type glycerol-3-phosphate transport system permease component
MTATVAARRRTDPFKDLKSGRFAALVGVGVFTLASLIPLVFILYQSLQSPSGKGWTFSNWTGIFENTPIVTGFLNSTILAVGSALVSVAIASAAGFVFAKLPFRGSRVILIIVVLTLALPLISAIVPLYLNLAKLGLIGSYPATILVYSAFNTAFAVIFFTNYFNSIPEAFIEAAILDGASYFTVFLRVMVPMAVPALVTIFVFDFLLVWNDLLVALLFMPGSNQETASVVLAAVNGAHDFHPQVILAGVFLATVPASILFLAFQRKLVLGFSVGMDK